MNKLLLSLVTLTLGGWSKTSIAMDDMFYQKEKSGCLKIFSRNSVVKQPKEEVKLIERANKGHTKSQTTILKKLLFGLLNESIAAQVQIREWPNIQELILKKPLYLIGYACLVDAKDFPSLSDYVDEALNTRDPMKQYCIALLYAGGTGVDKDFKKSFELHQKSAEGEFAMAQFTVGNIYKQGFKNDTIEVIQDYDKALLLLTKSAKKGCAKAQVALGDMYYNGEGVDKDENKAFLLYKKALDQGCTEAIARFFI